LVLNLTAGGVRGTRVCERLVVGTEHSTRRSSFPGAKRWRFPGAERAVIASAALGDANPSWADLRVVGAPVDFSPDGIVFDIPVKVPPRLCLSARSINFVSPRSFPRQS
jgi:hypothetical protein